VSTAVVIGNQSFTRRHPLAVWIGLPLITLGIYYFVWWYKINDEARRFLGDESIKPAMSVLAVTLGALVLVPPFISTYRTTDRIGRMQARAGFPDAARARPWISLLLSFVLGLNRLYLQMELNRIWDRYSGAAGPPPSAAPARPPVLPPATPPPFS
jgi:hypothetical protein